MAQAKIAPTEGEGYTEEVLRGWFEACDICGNGRVEKAEFLTFAIYHAVSSDPDCNTVYALCLRSDVDGNNSISRAEFREFMQDLGFEDIADPLFRKLDVNDSGRLSHAAMVQGLSRAAPGVKTAGALTEKGRVDVGMASKREGQKVFAQHWGGDDSDLRAGRLQKLRDRHTTTKMRALEALADVATQHRAATRASKAFGGGALKESGESQPPTPPSFDMEDCSSIATTTDTSEVDLSSEYQAAAPPSESGGGHASEHGDEARAETRPGATAGGVPLPASPALGAASPLGVEKSVLEESSELLEESSSLTSASLHLLQQSRYSNKTQSEVTFLLSLRRWLAKDDERALGAFQAADVNESGRVSQNELARGLHEMGFRGVPLSVIEMLFDEIDDDASYRLSFPELQAWVARSRMSARERGES